MAEVMVERYVEQVVDGLHYKGYTKMGGAKFEYELQFAVPVNKLDDMKPCRTQEEARQVFQLSIVKDGRKIELDNDEYGFFFRLLVEFAVQFYNESQARASNEGVMGDLLRGVSPLNAFGASVSIGMNSNNTYDLPSDLCAILSEKKFGCIFSG